MSLHSSIDYHESAASIGLSVPYMRYWRFLLFASADLEENRPCGNVLVVFNEEGNDLTLQARKGVGIKLLPATRMTYLMLAQVKRYCIPRHEEGKCLQAVCSRPHALESCLQRYPMKLRRTFRYWQQ